MNLFFEPSTRTRTSFELAAKRLSADVINFSPSASSVVKGETLLDTARNIEAMQADIIVLRHSSAGAAETLANGVKSSVINAGDGWHEHPTQALLDLYTIRQRGMNFRGLRVAIVGDVAHSRVARSNIYALLKLGAEVRLVGPPTMMPRGVEKLGAKVYYKRLFSDEFNKLMVRALVPGGAAATQCEQPFFDTDLIKEVYRSAKELTKNPAYYYANIPTYPGGGIGFIYVSDTPWQNGLNISYPPGVNQYINPDVHRAAFALPEFFRKELYGESGRSTPAGSH